MFFHFLLFVIRVAEDVANSSSIADKEFAVSQLNKKTIVVLGLQALCCS